MDSKKKTKKREWDFHHLRYFVDPITSDEAAYLREMLWKVYTDIKANAYFVTNDVIRIKTSERDTRPYALEHVPASLIVSHLVNRSSTIFEGGPGSGKTKIVKIVSRMMTGSSIVDTDNIVYCDEELSKDKWLAFPDIKKMLHDPPSETEDNKFDVIWAPFFRMSRKGPDLIVDEINRANPRTQNELLSLMAEGIAQYAVSASVKINEFHLYFTENPLDEVMGSNIYPLGFAFKDRVTMFVPVSQASSYAMKRFTEVRPDDRDYEQNDDISVMPVMTSEEMRAATVLASKMPVDDRAKKFAQYLVRDANLCKRSPQNDKMHAKHLRVGEGLCNGCHFADVAGYHCQKFFGGSMRGYNDLIAIGKAYAFWLGFPSVTEQVIYSIAPDVIGHRTLILPKQLREDARCFGDERKFLQTYLIDWCYSLLSRRQSCEEAFDRLYSGKGQNPNDDINALIMSAQNDLYVRWDLLPRVVNVDVKSDSGNLKEEKIVPKSSTANPKYREYCDKIRVVMESTKPSKDKWDDLEALVAEIFNSNVDFLQNLIDMVYAHFSVLGKIMKREKAAADEVKKKEDA